MTTPDTAACDAYIDLGTSMPGPEPRSVRAICERIAGHDKSHVASVFGFTGPHGGARSADVEWMT